MRRLIPVVIILLIAAGCNYRPPQRESGTEPTPATSAAPQTPLVETPTPPVDRLLTICLGREPGSLFLYADGGAAARAVRQAIYDGPFDVVGFRLQPVILEVMPTLADGGAAFEPVNVAVGNVVIDANGQPVKLADGVVVLPSGCADGACAAAFSAQAPVQMDQMVVRFRLRQGILWADGEPLSADDSVYAYELARSMYPRVRAELLDRTVSYRALDELTVEWRGAPGYRSSGFEAHFFTPMPRHAWGGMALPDLTVSDAVNRLPLGWGPYTIDEWVPGDHITLSKNPNYFRLAEGLPVFNKLVFRFIADRGQAVNALNAGECDLLDETHRLETLGSQVAEMQASGQLKAYTQPGSAWEHLDFGIQPLNPPESGGAPAFFAVKEVRQAVAYCVDRARIAAAAFAVESEIAESYIAAAHPLFNPDMRRYAFDPAEGTRLLEAAGWIDADGSPATPRSAQGVAGIADGTSFEVTLLTGDDEEKARIGAMVQESLVGCGIKVNLSPGLTETVFAPGPEGPVFGRNFTLAQFGWVSAVEPPCFLYTTQEIPGPYPQYPRGWGGANASGYSNPEFDRICRAALAASPESAEHRVAHFAAQAVFAEDLPSLPLYLRLKTVASRPDFCGIAVDASTETALWNLEGFDYGQACP